MTTLYKLFIISTGVCAYTYNLAIPAFLTAELTAFTAVCMLTSNCVRSPVANGTFLCSARTNLVRVIQLESITPLPPVLFTPSTAAMVSRLTTDCQQGNSSTLVISAGCTLGGGNQSLYLIACYLEMSVHV